MKTIYAYISRQLWSNMLAVTLVLLLIFMSGRFIKYLAQAASGGISADVIFSIMLYRLPGFLELILPLGFFIAILLVYGRMYIDSEITVLHAGGFSRARLLGIATGNGVLVASLVAAMSLYLSPKGFYQVEEIFRQQAKLTAFEMVSPGRFQTWGENSRVIYVESLSDDKRQMNQVFIAQNQENTSVKITASSGRQIISDETGDRYLLLSDGWRYNGLPGETAFEVVQFDSYGLLLDQNDENESIRRKDAAISTTDLMLADDAKSQSLLHWRLALPFIVPIVGLIAVSLSKVEPRQGRFVQLIPAMLLYVGYLGCLVVVQKAAAKGQVPPSMGMFGVHAVFLFIGLVLFNQTKVRRWLTGGRASA